MAYSLQRVRFGSEDASAEPEAAFGDMRLTISFDGPLRMAGDSSLHLGVVLQVVPGGGLRCRMRFQR
jgi:hypothetical protein